jgi:hypothetical protein
MAPTIMVPMAMRMAPRHSAKASVLACRPSDVVFVARMILSVRRRRAEHASRHNVVRVFVVLFRQTRNNRFIN